MDSFRYYTHRLLPFFLVYFFYEMLEVCLLSIGGNVEGVSDFTALPGLLNETLISFLFCILPYLLYLLVLPTDFHGGCPDRQVSFLLFTLFCAVNAAKELVEAVSSDNFQLFSIRLLQHPHEAQSALWSLPGLWPGTCAALFLVSASVFLLGKRLMSDLPAPPVPHRLLVPFLLVVIVFIPMQAQTGLTVGQQSPELYRDGLFSLFGGLFALTVVPNLKLIFAPPCLWRAVALSSLWVPKTACTRYVGAAYAPPAPDAEALAEALRPLPPLPPSAVWSADCRRADAAVQPRPLPPLMDTTEAGYGEMARKILETGNWLQPQFEYSVPFWGKPPLSFQASTLRMKLCGINAAAARLAPFLTALTLGGLFFCWFFVRQRWEQGAAAFLVFLTSAIRFVSAGAVMTDIFLAFGVMLAMVSFRRAVNRADASRLWGYLFFLGLSIGLLIGIFFAAGGGFSHLEYRSNHKMLQAWDTSCPLYYTSEQVPCSGQFYSSDHAQKPGSRPTDKTPR